MNCIALNSRVRSTIAQLGLQPQTGAPARDTRRKSEAGRHHSRNGVGIVVDPNCLAEDSSIADKHFLPYRIAEDDRAGIFTLGFGDKADAQRRRRAQHSKQARTDTLPIHLKRCIRTFNKVAAGHFAGKLDVAERSALRPPLLDIDPWRLPVPDGAVRLLNCDQSRGIAERQGGATIRGPPP